MNAYAIQKADTMQWRCRACGTGKPTAGTCPDCGDPGGPGRGRGRNRLVAPAPVVSTMETFGNENVQQNVVNVYGDVDLGSEPEPEPVYAPVRSEGMSPLMRAFYASCTAVMWLSAITLGLVLAFFVVIFIKAFILRGL